MSICLNYPELPITNSLPQMLSLGDEQQPDLKTVEFEEGVLSAPLLVR
jgi:hypothetical protein